MLAAESESQQNLNRKREIVQEKKEAKQEKDEARRYQTMKEDLVYHVVLVIRKKVYLLEPAEPGALPDQALLRRAQPAEGQGTARAAS